MVNEKEREIIAANVEPEIKEKIQKIAETEHRTLSGQVEYILAKWIEATECEKKEAKK